MREVNYSITELREVEVTEQITKENIISKYDNKEDCVFEVFVEIINANDEVIKKSQYRIQGADYELLMSESPSFAPGKPQNECRETDIWYIVDLIRNRQ